MELFRLHAYAVFPKRTTEKQQPPKGGAVRITPALRAILEQSTSAARFSERTLVDFEMEGATRSNEIRDLVIAFGFEDGAGVKSAALGIATKLAEAMDMRSAVCLLVMTAMKEGSKRRVTVWTFPRDQAFRLQSRQAGATIQILTDVFSQTSKLRKAAQFEGRHLRSEFLQGRVLDFQANQVSHDVANFWINRFLQCGLSIADDAGTRMLAKSIRKAVDACSEASDKEQLLTAVMAVRTSPRRRWSLQSFADEYLSGSAKGRFLATSPNAEGRTSMFNFRRDEFEATLAYRVFTLETGVLVSAPLQEIGESVRVENVIADVGRDRVKHLTCEGTVVDEKVRARHA